MSDRSAYLIQIMNKIGAPLLRAIERKKASVPNATDVDEAQDIAKLLSRTVEMSVALSQSLDLSGDEEQADSVRLSLAALSGSILADVYTAAQKIPDEGDLKRIEKIMTSVLAFSDNFSPSQTHVARLRSLDGMPFYADEQQNSLYVMKAFVPVFSAVAEFSFGQTDTALMQDIFTRLHKDAVAVAQELAPDAVEDAAKIRHVELMILNTLADIYANVHTSKTAALIAMQEKGEEEPNLTIDDVWSAYEVRKSMALVLVSSILPGAEGSGDSLSPSPVAVPAPAPVENPVAPPQPVEVAPVAPTEPEVAPPQAAPIPAVPQTPIAPPTPPSVAPPVDPVEQPAQGAGGPMGFFKKPDANTAEPTQAAPQSNQVEPPALPSTSQEQPPAAPEAENTPPAGAGGPMSFFKTPPTKTDDGQ